MENDRVLILRTNDANGRSYRGFQWPRKVGETVTAPDWNPRKECGGGLYGALWGEGDGILFRWSEDAEWMVFSARKGDVIDLGGKVKVPTAKVEFIGDRKAATDWLRERASGRAIIGSIATSGDYGTSTSGNYGTSTSGNYGTSTSGYRGTSTSGYRGTSTSGDGGTSTSGYEGTSTSGNYGTSTSGNYGTSTSGYRGKAKAGGGGRLVVEWRDATGRERLSVGYVGEEGIKPDVFYEVDNNGEFIES